MKKMFGLFLSLTMSAALLAGCSSASTETTAAKTTAETTSPETSVSETASEEAAAEPAEVRIAALKGPTAMGMVQFMSQADSGQLTDNQYTFTIANAADEITPKLVQGEFDIAAVPSNLSSVLYNNTEGQVQVLAVNTLGVLYIAECGDTISTFADLQGKTIYSAGNGATPGYALTYLLEQNGMDPEKDVDIQWSSEHSESLAHLLADEDAVAMLPQPFMTSAQAQNDSVRAALDLNAEWESLQAANDTPSALITGVVVARKAFVEEHPEAVSAFLDHYRESVEFVNANVADAAQLVSSYEIVPAQVAEKAIPACNITFIEGAEMKEKLSGYLSILLEQNPKSVGGALPADDFYYSR